MKNFGPQWTTDDSCGAVDPTTEKEIEPRMDWLDLIRCRKQLLEVFDNPVFRVPEAEFRNKEGPVEEQTVYIGHAAPEAPVG